MLVKHWVRLLNDCLELQEKSLLYFRRDDAKSVQTAALTPLIALLECNTTNLKPATIGVNQELSDMLVRELRKSNRNNTCTSSFIGVKTVSMQSLYHVSDNACFGRVVRH